MKLNKTPLLSQSIFLFFCFVLSVVSFFLIRGIITSDYYTLGDFDIRAFYTGGQMAHSHITNDFFSPATQYSWQKQFFYVPQFKDLMPFVYPSFVALPFSLISAYPVATFYQITAFVNTLITVIAFFFLLQTLNIFSSRLITLVTSCLFLLYDPLWNGLAQGQLSFILFLTFILTWVLLKKERYFLAGLILSLVLVRPHLLVAPLFLFLWKREWKTLSGLGLGSVFLVLISSLMTGVSFLAQYMSVLFSFSSIAGRYAHPQIEATIRGFFQALFQTDSFAKIMPFYLTFALIAMSVLLYSWKGKMQTTGKLFDVQWSLLILVVILTSLHTNPHDLLLLAFPAIVCCHATLTYFFVYKNAPWQLTLISSLFIFLPLAYGIVFSYPLVVVPPTFIMLFLLAKWISLEKRRLVRHRVAN